VVNESLLNLHLRDNLSYLFGQLKDIQSGEVLADETTTTVGSYVDLSGGANGPAVTVNLEASQKCRVTVSSQGFITVVGARLFHAWAVSGTETVAASDNWAAKHRMNVGNDDTVVEKSYVFTASGVAGNRTFTSKYKLDTAGTAHWAVRHIIAEPQ
jgi:hypothetical protein